METATFLATALGLGASAGLNSWATLLVFGFVARMQPEWFPGELAAFFASPEVLITVGVIYVIEFVADKVPALDHAWDVVQTFVRPVAGAVLAFASASDAVPGHWVVLAAVAAGSTALGSHFGKAGTRVASTATTGGLANPVLSIFEDILAVGQALLAIFLPFVALALLVIFGSTVGWILLRRRVA